MRLLQPGQIQAQLGAPACAGLAGLLKEPRLQYRYSSRDSVGFGFNQELQSVQVWQGS
jgi:hypothetical protein